MLLAPEHLETLETLKTWQHQYFWSFVRLLKFETCFMSILKFLQLPRTGISKTFETFYNFWDLKFISEPSWNFWKLFLL
jgi:hypothetical protein